MQVQPQPRVVAPTDPESVPVLLEELNVWFLQLKRSTAGFNTLYQSLAMVSGQLPDTERKVGMPIFEFTSTLVGRETREPVKCSLDLKKLSKAGCSYVLVPLIGVLATELTESLNEIEHRVTTLRPLLAKMTGVAGVEPQT